MKQLLIVKIGTTYTSIAKKYGDFEDFISIRNPRYYGW